MKTKVDIITGFLDSGKTTFVNEALGNGELSEDIIVILQCESGEIEIDTELFKDKKVYIKKPDMGKIIDPEYINSILDKHYPDRIIIEYNGMSKLEDLFNTFEDRSVKKKCEINKVVNTIDAATFEVFMNNMGSILTEQISGSDLIVLNKAAGFSEQKLNNIEKTLKALNKSAKIVRAVFYDDLDENNEANNDYVYSQKKVRKKISDKLFFIFIAFIAVYLFFTVYRSIDFGSVNIDLSWLQALNTVFLSILMQAFPFILVGVFVSSVIQVFVSGETIVRIFPRRIGWGFVVAILAGVLLPVCDCAIVPVAARLVKKGVPLPAAMTFMLAAPIVNPIVIASTLYAFPGQTNIAIDRVYLGITIAFAVGLTFLFFPEEKDILLNETQDVLCNCGYCGEGDKSQKGIAGKLQSIFKHAGTEFFKIGKFLIIGAFLSSVMQTLIPKDIFNNLWGQSAIPLIIMMFMAFLFSVCSTSDAFIARSFINQFSMSSIMGFMVLGPMIDVKNMLMLLSSFRKGFVIKLVLLIFVVAFIALYLMTKILL